MTHQNDMGTVLNSSPNVSPAMAAAWERYRVMLEETRLKIYNGKGAEFGTPGQAHFLFHQLQAVAFNTILAPHQEYPRLQLNLEPMLYTWGFACADFRYTSLFMDGSREYRLWGKRGTTLFTQLMLMNGYMNDENGKCMGMWALDEFKLEPDGSFEIFIGGEKHGKNWLPLDANSRNNWIAFREAFYDWNKERGNEIHVERLGGPAIRPVVHDEQEFIRRLDGVARMMKTCIDEYITMHIDKVLPVVGFNHFHVDDHSANFKTGANPAAGYIACVYQLKDDEALLIETDLPKKLKYWSFQLADVWSQAAEFFYNQTSLNGHQARLDRDGKARLVVSKHDPGIHNWLDPLENKTGCILLRWYYADAAIIPTTRIIKLAELFDILPKDTPRISPNERQVSLRDRARGGLSRFDFCY